MLAEGLLRAVRAVEGYGGGVYLRSGNRRSLVLALVAGVPRSLLRAWWRIPVSGAVPAAEAYRTGRSIYLADAGETMRRFPQMSVGLPYPFASLYIPVRDGGEIVGVLVVLRAASHWTGLTAAERRRLRGAANRVGYGLTTLSREGRAVDYDADPVAIRMPAGAAAQVRVGMFDWDMAGGGISADDEACAIFGVDPSAFTGSLRQLASRVLPDDANEIRAVVREAHEQGRVLARRLRLAAPDGTVRPVEVWGQVPDRAEGEPRHLVGAVLDLGSGILAAEAAERLPDGIFSLDGDGRLTYANHGLEVLLRVDREELLGRYPWEVLPWLSDPAYEDRYRAAMLSQEPTSFMVCHPRGEWLAFVLYPDVHGLTGRVVPTGPPKDEARAHAADPSMFEAPGAPAVTVARAGALYHVVQMASVLTEAVTVREVCAVVADQLLPAFGGQEVALYLISDRRMHLAWQSGYPEGFLDRFEGVPLDARLPGVDALTSGVPIFFESERHLLSAYPGIPLDRMRSWAFLPLIASSHPVGSCILGFDTPHSFTTDERAALTALGGLVAQAVERARLYDAEFTLARGLQHALLPHRLPTITGVETAARYVPGTQGMEIGGDWYDVIQTSRGVAVVVGDVEGHNVAAAATMGQLRSAAHAFAASGAAPEDVVRRTNDHLVDLDAGLMASCVYVELDPGSGRAQIVRAGHPPPLLRHPHGPADVLEIAGGTLLGVDRQASFPVTKLDLSAGSVLAMYTDGLVEQAGQDIEEGIELLRSSFAHLPAMDLESTAERLVQSARRSTDRPDDAALLLTAYVGTGEGSG
ncbi:diguanylate cyclase [Wenjunlia tyrosinilytica]|uniref:protein-serine/threonine phosphatase n=1 Tax=Wenjunlia tyrosinilytica TaxID=1544741 RepID=A0A917ZP75_9ACTN|nr:diguanylate cyclase [Wenjunlia tyrosinilytica]